MSDEIDIAARLNTMLLKLRDLRIERAEFPDSGVAPGVVDWRDRGAAGRSLAAVIEFLETLPAWREADLAFDLRHLLISLTNINNGRSERWLENQAPNRSQIPIEVENARGRCAGVMQLMKGTGLGREAAARFVVKHLPPGAFDRLALLSSVTTADKPKWETVAEWRDTLGRKSKSPPGYENLKAGYDAQIALAATLPQPVEEVCRAALRNLSSAC